MCSIAQSTEFWLYFILVAAEGPRYVYNDDDMDYNEEVKESLYSMADYVAEGINDGAEKGFLILGYREQLWEPWSVHLSEGSKEF